MYQPTVIVKIDLAGPERRGFAMGLNEFAGYGDVAVSTLATGYVALVHDCGQSRSTWALHTVGAILAGLTADAFGVDTAVWLVAASTFASGLVVAVRMKSRLSA